MLKSFDKAFKDFESNGYSKLHGHCFDATTEARNFQIQIQAQSLASDVGYLGMIVRDLHVAAVADTSKRMDERVYRDNVAQTISIPMAKLAVGFKCFFLIIRAYQDLLYKIILGIENQPNGANSSMKKAIDSQNRSFKQDNPAGSLLSQKCSQYAEWFIDLRDRRNLMKYGIGVSYITGKNYVTGEINVVVKMTVPGKRISFELSLNQITQALNISAKATKAVIEYGTEKGRVKEPHKNLGVFRKGIKC